VFGKLAEIAGKYLKKGSNVYLEGQIVTREWMDKENNKRYTTEIVLNGFNSKLVFLDSKDSGGGSGPAAAPKPKKPVYCTGCGVDTSTGDHRENCPKVSGNVSDGLGDEDIPF